MPALQLTALTGRILGKREEVTALLEEASYVTVRELPATDWGYGGMTQEARRRAGGVADAGPVYVAA